MLHRVQVRDISTSTVQRRLCELGLHGQIAAKTLSVTYLEFKVHLTSMATTAFCSDTPSHLVCAQWDHHLFFNRTMTQHTFRLGKGYITKKERDKFHILTFKKGKGDT